MTKHDLRSGMFGKLNDGDLFVVVNDKLIYEKGQLDDINGMNDDMVFVCSGNHIVELYEAECFNQVREGRCKLIWKRPEVTGEPKEEAKSENGKVTITEDEFLEAVKKANEVFMEIGEEVPDSEMATAIMALQNMAFGAIIGAVLFDKEIK